MDWLKKILTENQVAEEEANKIIEGVKKEVPKYYALKEDFNSKIKEVEGLNTQISTLNKDIENLKKVDPTKLQEEITRLQGEQSELVKTHQEELSNTKFNNALELAIVNSKTIDPIGLKAHLKLEDLKLDDKTNEVIGFNDQLTKIKENQKYLFEETSVATGEPQGGMPTNSNEFNFGFTGVREMPKNN